MDEELLELYKQVYEATKFETGEWFEITENLIVTDEDKYIMEQDTVDTPYDFTPRYTSDYLLEKLATPLIFDNNDCAIEVRRTKGDKYKWSANIRHSYGQYFKQVSDTPLKAILKLVIALGNAGVKL